MSNDQYYEDIPQLVRGGLEPARAAEILRAAETDEGLRRAIGSERALEKLLELYEVPQPAPGLEGVFWRRFHEGKVLGDESTGGRRAAWMFKLAGPLAAGVLIAIGIIAYFRGDDPVTPNTTADQPKTDAADPAEEEWDDLAYFAGVAERNESALKKPDAETLATMKKVDSDAFLTLDRIDQPEDLTLIDDLPLLEALDRAEGK